MTEEEMQLWARLVARANKSHDGHLTVLKFTTNWRVGFLTPTDRQTISEFAVGATFSEAALRALDMDGPASVPSFVDFLRSAVPVSGGENDLILDILRDREFPDVDTVQEVRLYLIMRGAPANALNAAESLWQRYRADFPLAR